MHILDLPIETESRPAHSNQNWTHWTPHYIGHLISLDTSFKLLPISCCDFGRQLQMCSVNFLHIGAHPRLPGAGGLPLYKLHFVTVCPARNALMVFGPISHQLLTIHLLVLSLLLLPKLPPQPFGNMLSAKNCPSLLQFREPASILRRGRVRAEHNWVIGGKVTR